MCSGMHDGVHALRLRLVSRDTAFNLDSYSPPSTNNVALKGQRRKAAEGVENMEHISALEITAQGE